MAEDGQQTISTETNNQQTDSTQQVSNSEQDNQQQLSQADTQTQTLSESNEENNQQGDEDINKEVPPTPPVPSQEEYDKLQARLKEYELSDQEVSQLKNRLGVDSVDYETSQLVRTLDIIQNQAQQEYIRLCNQFGVDYRPEAIEASSKALLEKDPKSYYELQTQLDRLSNAYIAKQNEVQNYATTREVNSFYNANAQFLQASPVLSNLVNEYVSYASPQDIQTGGLNNLLERAKALYTEAFNAGVEFNKLSAKQDPGKILNNSVATQTSPSYPTDSGQHVFSREEIRRMSDADFAKNQKLIEQQMIQGLIK